VARDFEDHCWRDIVSDEILRVYEPYHRDLFVGERPALLAIDLYNLVYRGGAKEPHEIIGEFPSSCGKYAWEAVEPTKALFSAARNAGIPVVYTTAPMTSTVVATNRQSGLASSDDDYNIFEAFAPQDGDIMIVKERASAFYGTPILPELNRLGVKSLIVRASAVDAYSAGYHVTLAEECVFDRSLLSHKVNLFDLHHKYADVLGVDEIVTHLEQAKQAA